MSEQKPTDKQEGGGLSKKGRAGASRRCEFFLKLREGTQISS